METKRTSLQNMEKLRTFLENTADANALAELNIQIEKEGASYEALPSVASKFFFHSGEGLSPAGGIATAPDGRIFIADEFNHRVCSYSPEGELLKSAGSKGKGDGELHYPRGIAIGTDGDIYVADAWNHRISVFDGDLIFKSSFGSLGTGLGELDEPSDLCMAGESLAVLEKSNHRIHFFAKSGEPIGTVGKRGSVNEQKNFYLLPFNPELFSPPVFEFPSSIASDSRGNLYVADTNNHRIVKITANYEADSSFAVNDVKYPSGIACDSSGNIHLTRFNYDKVSVFSPEGSLLYKYSPGVELPISIMISGDALIVGGGAKPDAARHELQPKLGGDINLENDFPFLLKRAIADLANGDWSDGMENLSKAASLENRLSGEELAKLLPEHDYQFCQDESGIENSQKALPFLDYLIEESDLVMKSFENNLNEKIAAIDRLTEASLNLEKSYLAGAETSDDFRVAKYRKTKRLLAISTSIKTDLAAFKKITEFARRLSFLGVGTEKRIAHLTENLKRWMETREPFYGWYSAAEKIGPTLNFNSPPESRAPLLENFNRIELTAFEFSILSGFVREQNREAGALAEKFQCGGEKLFQDYLGATIDFFVMVPELLGLNAEHLKSLDSLFAGIGDKNAGDFLSAMSEPGLWKPLTIEENIKPEPGSSYRLLASLWTTRKIDVNSDLKADSWEKINGFYYKEFERFLKENEPLRTELIRLRQQHPIAHKTDPRQAVEIEKKIGLLMFHLYYQERYIVRMMKEFTLRYALLSLEKISIKKEELTGGSAYLLKTLQASSANFYELIFLATENQEKVKASKNIDEKNSHSIEYQLTNDKFAFNETYGNFLGLIKNAFNRNLPTSANGLEPLAAYFGKGDISRPFNNPTSIVMGDNGAIFTLSQGSRFIEILNQNCNSLGRFGSYGNMPGKLLSPLSLNLAPNGELLVSAISEGFIAAFTQSGKFIRRFKLSSNKKDFPMRIQSDSSGRIFASFFDGKGIEIFDKTGNYLSEIPADSPALSGIEKVWGFAISADKLIVAGNGKVIFANIDGTKISKIETDGLNFGTIANVAYANGNVFALEFGSGRLFHINEKDEEIKVIENIPGQGLVAIAAKDNILAVGDYISNSVWTFKF